MYGITYRYACYEQLLARAPGRTAFQLLYGRRQVIAMLCVREAIYFIVMARIATIP